MSSREERPGSWRTETNDVSDPSVTERDAILESLATPLPPEIDRDRRERSQSYGRTEPRQEPFRQPAAEATRPMPRPERGYEPRPGSGRQDPAGGPGRYGPVTPGPRVGDPDETRPAPRRRPALRRVKRTLRHVDPISILKLALFFSACLLVVWLFVVAVIYWIADARGLFDAIEDLSQGLALGWQEEITLFYVERWAFLIGFTVAVLSSLVSVFLAFLYNVAADFIGGAEMTFVERDG